MIAGQPVSPDTEPPDMPSVPSPGTPVESGPEGILKAMREFLLSLSDMIHLEGYCQAFWAGDKPVPEKTIDAIIKPLLVEYIESRGGHCASQTDTGVGICDYWIAWDKDRLIVELKPSYGNWKQGIKKELQSHVESQKRNHAAAGLFFVLSFEGKFRPESNELTELLELRDGVCRECDTRIDVAIVDCDKPAESASKGNVPPKSGDALKYYEFAQ